MRAIFGIRRTFCLIALALIPLAAIAKKPVRGPEISLVTLNLYHDKADWPKRLPLILAELRRLNPDVITLQEVIGRENLRNQAQTLADELGYEYAFSSVDPESQPQRYGNAILTRRPILAQHWTRLEPLDDSRTALHLRIAVGDRTLNVYTTHLHWTDGGGAIRQRQVADLMRFIADTADGAPSLVAGDFNAVAAAPELKALTEGFADAYGALHPNEAADPKANSTLNLSYYPPKRIDHVFLQRGVLVPESATVILNRPDSEGHWPSDHYGVAVRLRLPPPARSAD
ncbi:endonuclease/exonuclease/phosphatase family protein [Luteimonas gilva]|uniref:Endonuclease/exonuclease/phosphatase family protein n=1 Tax=Luteimonas gilva TaxID=2572684 RepID=A0A4U5JYY8_9GAMM|nr:endonuclease/exonuclease/phosphatase family protein [Luteimonas gilva]